MFRRTDPSGGTIDQPREPTPEEQSAFESGAERVAEEKRRALADPGPGWSTWFYQEAAKVWLSLLFLIVDAWIAAEFLRPIQPIPLVLLLAAAVYLEILAYMYFWARPSDDLLTQRGGQFRPTWYRPVRYGRWTPEAARARARGSAPVVTPDGTPDPTEFV